MSTVGSWIAALRKKYRAWRFVEEEVPEPFPRKKLQDLRVRAIEIKKKIRLLEMFGYDQEAAIRRMELFEVDKKIFAHEKQLRKNAA